MPGFSFTDNLGAITDFGLHFHPDEPALLQQGRTLTYRELDDRINRVACGLLDAGVGSGDRVLILWENDIRFVEATLGTIRAGAVAVPVNPNLTEATHRMHLNDSGAIAVLCGATAADHAAHFADDDQVVLAVAADSTHANVVEHEAWLSSAPARRPEMSADPGDLAWLPYTSGTTGTPKGVKLAHQMLLRDAQLLSQNCYLNSSDRVVLAAPLFHMNAAACGILPMLLVGGSVYVLPSFEAATVLRTFSEQRATYSLGVPAMFKLMLAQDDSELSRDFSTLRLICCGSAPMPPSLINRLTEIFPNARFVEGYGLTECGPAATMNPLIGPRRNGSIGRPLPGFEARIVDYDGNEVTAGNTGELWLRSPLCTTLGYLGRPDEDARKRKPDGWFATGDLAMCDDDGWLYFRGRADDRMNVGGENVYPAEVEAILTRHPQVRDVAVVALPHDTKGQVPVAFVVREAGSDLDESSLREFFFTEGPAYAHPRRIHFLDSLPLSPTGKTDRRSLIRQAHDSTPADISGGTQ
ncbi:acyl--CoA ligase [Gordonia sp. PP30]|uniref:class I adenylate-forming enzyme family protein n=1 Tax=Gordonia sp. PP30 TaxID=2935861 RepID=UPI001FFF7F97|nr:class I adenylate-forming enzyme family protein [Gordonia sp. PP30]UQE75244.1 acyl--CoA ligase [Gordonia sp. PP30]